MRHTPGPWVWGNYCEEVSPDDPEACELVAYGEDDGKGNRPIIDILSLHDDCKIDPANARLIAVAPELLEALKALLTVMDDGPCPRKLEEALTWRDNDEKARAMAVAAIAKAEGRQ